MNMVKFSSASLKHALLRASGIAHTSFGVTMSVGQRGHRRRLQINLAASGDGVAIKDN
jgi:hypothetical protein